VGRAKKNLESGIFQDPNVPAGGWYLQKKNRADIEHPSVVAARLFRCGNFGEWQKIR
jgi:hypothetical protein